MSVSMYQGQVKRLDSEIASLEGKIAQAMKTQTKSEKDIQSVERSITRNTSASSLELPPIGHGRRGGRVSQR